MLLSKGRYLLAGGGGGGGKRYFQNYTLRSHHVSPYLLSTSLLSLASWPSPAAQRGCSSEIFEKHSKRCQNLFHQWGSNEFLPRPKTYQYRNTVISLTVVILDFSTLSGTNLQILTPKRYDEQRPLPPPPHHFLRRPPKNHAVDKWTKLWRTRFSKTSQNTNIHKET